MALGGGTWFAQNKKLPGAYINFVSLAKGASALTDRGAVGIGLVLDWGVDGEVMTVEAEDFAKNCQKIFGYAYDADEMKGLRDLFLNTRVAYVYKLNSNTSSGKASNTFATALYAGTRGNDLKIRIAANADDPNKWDVDTILDTLVVDSQTVASAAALVANDYVTFDGTATLAATAGTALTGGADAATTAANHQTFLDKIEAYSVNAVGVVDKAATVNALYAAWCRRMRDEMGIKLQVVLYNYAGDYEGVVNVKNAVSDTGWDASSLVYWVTGVVAGTAVNASALNMIYNGEFTVGADYTQDQLEAAIDAGEFTLHKVGSDLRVLADINSLVTVTTEKGAYFKKNQTIRVIDEIAISIASIFNSKYIGQIPNDAEGRVSLWADIVAHHQELERIRAIEDFDDEQVTVEAGTEKGAVVVNDAITIIGAMEKLYMTCIIG